MHFWDVPRSAVTWYGTVPASDPVTTLADLVPRIRRNQAVSALDSALHCWGDPAGGAGERASSGRPIAQVLPKRRPGGLLQRTRRVTLGDVGAAGLP